MDAGYAVLQAEDGYQALALLTDGPSLRMLTSDIIMPEMSGIELAEEAVRRRPELPVILVSGFVEPQELRWPFLRKPFCRAELGDLVAREIAGMNYLCSPRGAVHWRLA